MELRFLKNPATGECKLQVKHLHLVGVDDDGVPHYTSQPTDWEDVPTVVAERPCDHNWVDARNEVVLSGKVCTKCGLIGAIEPASPVELSTMNFTGDEAAAAPAEVLPTLYRKVEPGPNQKNVTWWEQPGGFVFYRDGDEQSAFLSHEYSNPLKWAADKESGVLVPVGK